MTPEGSLLLTVGDLLTTEQVWWVRMSTGSMVLADGKHKPRIFRAGRKGMADILALPWQRWCGKCDTPYVPDGPACKECGTRERLKLVPVWIECKSAVGRQSPHQRDFQREVEAEGHKYLLVRDAREVEKWLKENR